MRKILFRGKQKIDMQWVEGDLIHDPCGVFIEAVITQGLGYNRVKYKVLPETVGQFIGVVDKSRKMVFEGDIVKFKGELYVVKYIEKYNRFADVKPKTVFAVFNFSMAEIVGNVYDNPELLTGGNENE